MSRQLSIPIVIMSVILSLAVSSCRSSRTVTTGASGYNNRGGGKNVSVSAPSVKGLDNATKTLLLEAQSWVGTPYKYAGNDRNGVDCSGFVTQVYLRALDIKLPRSSREQSEFCQRVDKSRLTPGDLLFFRTTKGSDRVSHVGIFVGDNKMIHSSTSQGVIYSDLSTDYYVRTYACAGKVGQYHAMLSGKAKTERGEEKNKERNPKKNEAMPVELPVEIAVEDLDRVLGTPASGEQSVSAAEKEATKKEKREIREKKTKEVKPAKTPVSGKASITPVAGASATTDKKVAVSPSEPSHADARTAVLNSIKEKDLTK